MAKTLNTRIQLKKDTLSNWNTNNPVLLPGEVAIVETQGVGDSSALISTRLKIGDGTTHFKDLKWVEAIASDVAAWAKQAVKPKYTAQEVGAAPVEHTHTKAQISDMPTKLSEFSNDAGFLTAVPAEYATKEEMKVELSKKVNINDLVEMSSSDVRNLWDSVVVS